MIGARDVAFPRLNMFGYWVVLFGGLFMYSSFFLGGAPNGGWFGYTPLTSTPISGGVAARARPRLLGRRHRAARHRVDHVGDQLHRHHPQHARAGHDAHAHAGVHVDDAGRRVPHRVRDADRHRGDDHGVLRPQLRHLVLRWRRRAAIRCSISTSSGCSAIPRCTSSSCRAWASCPRCCPSSRASRCSATRWWCSPASRSGSSAGACGRTTCSPPASGRSPSPRSGSRRCSSRSRPA